MFHVGLLLEYLQIHLHDCDMYPVFYTSIVYDILK